MNLHRAILACFLTALALASSPVRGAVGLNCDLSDCGIGRDAHRLLHEEGAKSRAPTEHEIRGRIEDLKGFDQRVFCFDTRECRDDAHEHCYQAPHCGFPSDNRNCVGVIINCQKLCGATATQDSAASPLALVDDSADTATESSVSPTKSSPEFVVAADTPTVPAEADTPPQSENDQPKTTKSDSSNAQSDMVQDDSAKPSVDFTALDPPAPAPFLVAADVPAPFTASVSTDSFGPVAFDLAEGSQSANPEPASVVIWGGMAAIALGMFARRRHHDA